jgi:inward rectifier potassium channel
MNVAGDNRANAPESSSDLGFGSVVSRESRERLLNPDGTFNVVREGMRFWETLSVYHALLTMTWVRFFTVMAGAYLGLNALFATLYLLCGANALSGHAPSDTWGAVQRAFFFSVQTLSTVGFGAVSPATLTANLVVTFEAVTGLIVFALASGLAFARFSRPVANIIFSKSAIIAPYHGITALEFRITNGRKNQIIELDATLMYTRFEEGPDGPVRRFYRLELERAHVTFFPLSWTIVHPINEASPLWGVTREEMQAASGEFLCLLTGIDETFSQTVHARSSYLAEEVIWNVRFADIFERARDGKPLRINVRRLGAVLPSVVTSPLSGDGAGVVGDSGTKKDVKVEYIGTGGAGN